MHQIGYKLEKWQWPHNFSTGRHGNFFDFAVFPLSSLVTGLSFMLISLLVLKLWQFLFVRDSPKMQKLEIPLSWFLSDTWRLGRVRDTKFGTSVSNEKLLNAAKWQVTVFTVSELLRLNNRGMTFTPSGLGLKQKKQTICEYNITWCLHFMKTYQYPLIVKITGKLGIELGKRE